MMDDPYSILNVYPDCTYEEAKAAYRQAALMHHPDRQPSARREEATRRFRVVAQAFQQICQELGHPIDLNDLKPGGSQMSNGSSTRKSTSASTTNSNPASIKPAPNDKSAVLARSPSTKAITQAPKSQKAISAKPEPASRSESALQTRPAVSKSKHKAPQANQPDEEYSSEESDHEASHQSRLPPPTAQINEPVADYPSSYYHGRPHPSSSRRSSFSHPGGDLLNSRAPANDYYHHPLGPPKQCARQPEQPDHRQQLYNLPGSGGRGKEWDFGLGEDDFFNSGTDRFGPGSSMMNEISSGFDRMMSTAFKGLSMAGPDPAELARMDGGQNCSMRMRQSKMVMGRTEDGSWAGKRMEKQMNMANGRLEVNENAQDIRMGGRAGGSRYPTRNGNPRGNAEDWDPPPAYQGGGEEDCYGPESYDPNMEHYQPGYQHPQSRLGGHPAALVQGGYGPMSRMGHGEMIPGHGRQGSLSRSRNSVSGIPDGYPDDGNRLQRRPSYYAPELAHPSRPPPMAHPAFAVGPPLIGRSLARRPSGEISARY
ncbi:hypothetical protein PGT21_009715 [Puccinia graminis f. sp. tritici]|uniref:J domain-containing protein n=2 Tax=Puccinia graminis f. sp. tritici TaxID=56615 RepID=E3JYT2_PUCGT|nr:uncharacterized protein PGTG_03163 [Puccinia graminis f. sp. tritici CRL 75-36-700-3]EFP77207.2 hypothetical protein PGTG_03163 [Puccinia graminis f. sp. tritici CRL 75-36-700-3]KAA1114456.1 hypothetical protein PGT21_009715 [Puccinia graminis f. sp. tritici]